MAGEWGRQRSRVVNMVCLGTGKLRETGAEGLECAHAHKVREGPGDSLTCCSVWPSVLGGPCWAVAADQVWVLAGMALAQASV